MKKFVLGSIALMALAGTAIAADMQRPAYKAEPMMAPAPVYNWTGCYVGANIGGIWGNADISGPFGGVASGNNSGFAGGGQIGCDYQMGPFVIGIRDMFDGTSLKNSGTFGAPLAGYTSSGNTHWFDTLTARGGYLVTPNVLFYAQGGVAWAQRSQTISDPTGLQVASLSNNTTGWTVGGGAEWMFMPHWSAFLEYNYMRFGTSSATLFTPVGIVAPTVCQFGCSLSANANVSDVLIGVNYRF